MPIINANGRKVEVSDNLFSLYEATSRWDKNVIDNILSLPDRGHQQEEIDRQFETGIDRKPIGKFLLAYEEEFPEVPLA